MPILTRPAELGRVLQGSRVVAVLGARKEGSRPSHYVPDYLHRMGYQILPVNPELVGEELWGEPVVARLDHLAQPVDLVDVFRRSDRLADHLDEILAMRPLPRAVWFQVGIRDDEVARALTEAGIDVVQDACTMVEHRHAGLGPIA